MIDIRIIREQPELVEQALVALNVTAPVAEIRQLDSQRRALVSDADALKAERNEGSKAVKSAKDPEQRQELIVRMRALGDRINEIDESVRSIDAELRHLLLQVPNLPAEQVPVGRDEAENVVVSEHGEERRFDFEPRPHWDLATELGIIDFDRGVKVAGSRNYFLIGEGARLQRALIAWMLDLHTRQHGYTEIYPPYLVTHEMLEGTGQLPKFGETLFRDHEEDKWLIPTAEVPVTNMYRDELIAEEHLPINHVAYSACFRREQISAGRDVRGIKRGYQFDKVELVKLVHPDKSDEEFEILREHAVEVLRQLGLRYRVLQICTGDLSFTAANKIDLEVWAPGSQEWQEVSSISTFRDFQARRANLRYRPALGGKPQFVHTLNGSGLALPRTMIAVLEHYQNSDGSITVPEVLRSFFGGQFMIGRQTAYAASF